MIFKNKKLYEAFLGEILKWMDRSAKVEYLYSKIAHYLHSVLISNLPLFFDLSNLKSAG